MERKFSRGWHTVLGSWEWDTIFKKTHVIESHKKQHNTAPPIECTHYRLPLDELANLRFRAQLTWMGIKPNCAAPPDFLNCIWTNGSSYDAGLWQSKKKKCIQCFIDASRTMLAYGKNYCIYTAWPLWKLASKPGAFPGGSSPALCLLCTDIASQLFTSTSNNSLMADIAKTHTKTMQMDKENHR